MTGLISLFTGKYGKYICLGIAVFVIFLYWNGRNNTIENLKEQLSDLKAEIYIKDRQYAENVGKLEFEILSQNNEIQKLNDDYTTLENKSKVEVATANTKNEQLSKELSEKLKLLNSVGEMSCQEAVELVVDLAKDNRWPKEKGVK